MSEKSLFGRLVALPGQTVSLVTEVPGWTIDTGRQLLADATEILDQGGELVRRVAVLVETVELLVADIALIAARADEVVNKADIVAESAAQTLSEVGQQLRVTRALLDAYAPSLVRLEPVVQQVSDSVEPRHVEAVAQLLDVVPEAIDLVLPALKGLGDLTPELTQLADRFEDIGQIVEGLPGAGLLKRRGESNEENSSS